MSKQFFKPEDFEYPIPGTAGGKCSVDSESAAEIANAKVVPLVAERDKLVQGMALASDEIDEMQERITSLIEERDALKKALVRRSKIV